MLTNTKDTEYPQKQGIMGLLMIFYSILVKLSRYWVRSVIWTKMKSEENMKVFSLTILKEKLQKNSFWRLWRQVKHPIFYLWYDGRYNDIIFTESSGGRVSVSSVWWGQQWSSQLFWISAGETGAGWWQSIVITRFLELFSQSLAMMAKMRYIYFHNCQTFL